MSLDGFCCSQKIAMDEVGLSVIRSVGNCNHWDDAKGEYVQLSAQEFRETYDKDNLPTLTFFHPDKYVARTVDDLVTGRDPQLEAALTYLAK